MPESDFTARIVRELRARNAVVCVIHQGRYSTPGTPDRYVCHRYWTGLLEFKDEGTRLRPEQRAMIREIRRRVPWAAFVVRAPGFVEDERGEVLAEFDGTGHDLVEALVLLTVALRKEESS